MLQKRSHEGQEAPMSIVGTTCMIIGAAVVLGLFSVYANWVTRSMTMMPPPAGIGIGVQNREANHERFVTSTNLD
jgi:hypothetical protein